MLQDLMKEPSDIPHCHMKLQRSVQKFRSMDPCRMHLSTCDLCRPLKQLPSG